jgi:adenylate cyclase
MSAVDLTSFMNAYLTPMTDAILVNEGTVDKYMGDAILAFWNAPVDVLDHTKKAVITALRMRQELKTLNNTHKELIGSSARPLQFGIGLDHGPCSVGNMGSAQRFDYSVLGDTVNFASRLDHASVYFFTDILASKNVKDSAPDHIWLEVGLVQVVGKSEYQEIFALVEGDKNNLNEFQRKWTEQHNLMISYYKQKQFIDSLAIAIELKNYCNSEWKKFYANFEELFFELSNTKLPHNWEPVWRLKNK